MCSFDDRGGLLEHRSRLLERIVGAQRGPAVAAETLERVGAEIVCIQHLTGRLFQRGGRGAGGDFGLIMHGAGGPTLRASAVWANGLSTYPMERS